MVRKLAALMIVTVFGPAATARGALPQSTLSLPQSTVAACPCAVSGACSCGTTGCGCKDACGCTVCPGKAGDGIARDYADAVESNRQYGCPMVAFVGVPARSVKGAISYHLAGRVSGIYVGTGPGNTVATLPADATDVNLLAAVRAVLPGTRALVPVPAAASYHYQTAVSFTGSFGGGGCSGGRCH